MGTRSTSFSSLSLATWNTQAEKNRNLQQWQRRQRSVARSFLLRFKHDVFGAFLVADAFVIGCEFDLFDPSVCSAPCDR